MLTFKLTDHQEAIFEEFRKRKTKERAKKKKRDAAIGGAYTFCFTPTGIGTVIEVICNDDMERINLTEEENW